MDTMYDGIDPQGGPVWTKVKYWAREFRGNPGNTTPVSFQRVPKYAWPLQTPYGQVSNHDGEGAVPDHWATIGPDFNIPSDDYMAKLHKCMGTVVPYLQGTDAATGTLQQGVFTRVVGAKHDFYFTNFMRHPVQVLFVYDSDQVDSGDQQSPSELMDDLSREPRSAKTAGSADVDPEALRRIANCSESIIIPPTLDNDDMAVTVKHTIKFSPKEFDPESFSIGPMAGRAEEGGLWRRVNPHRFSETGFVRYNADATSNIGDESRLSPWWDWSPDDIADGPIRQLGTQVWMYMRLVVPHGQIMGSRPAEPGWSTGTTMAGYRKVNVAVKSQFINEVMSIGQVKASYAGVYAYPSNTNASS